MNTAQGTTQLRVRLRRALGVLVLCVGILLGVVSPSSAAPIGPVFKCGTVDLAEWGGTYVWTGAGTCTFQADDRTDAAAWRVTVTYPPNLPYADSRYAHFMAVGHCSEGAYAGQWRYSNTDTFIVVSGGGTRSTSVLAPLSECTAYDLIGVVSQHTDPGPSLSWSGTAPGGVTGPPVNGPADISAGNCIGQLPALAALLRSAGWSDDADGHTALAVLLAESRGRVNALHKNDDGSYDYGLFQVNDQAHPDYDPQRLGTDPLYNAQAAWQIRQTAGDWSPWVTYTTGLYRQWLSAAVSAWQDPAAVDPLPAANCAQLTGSEPPSGSTDPVDPNDPANGRSCTGWNPLTYFKCALSWAFVPSDGATTRWSEQVSSISDHAPVSTARSGYNTFQDVWDALRCGTADQAGYGQCPDLDLSMPVLGTTTVIDPMQSAGQLMNDGPGPFHWIYDAIKVGLWVGAVWWIWTRVAATFGGKG